MQTDKQEHHSKDSLLKSLKRSLITQLNTDLEDAELDEDGRRRKVRCFYKTKLHPDKWMGWPEMAGIMTELSKELNNVQSRFEKGGTQIPVTKSD